MIVRSLRLVPIIVAMIAGLITNVGYVMGTIVLSLDFVVLQGILRICPAQAGEINFWTVLFPHYLVVVIHSIPSSLAVLSVYETQMRRNRHRILTLAAFVLAVIIFPLLSLSQTIARFVITWIICNLGFSLILWNAYQSPRPSAE